MSKKLLIAVPSTDYMHADFVKSLVKLEEELSRKGIAHRTEVLSGTLVYYARIKLANMAINERYDNVLWLDSDMVFPETIAEDLLDNEKDMVCGAFVARRPNYSACVYSSIQKNNIKKVETFGVTPFRVDGCGFACVLTSRDLLQRVTHKFGTSFMPTDYYGEDLAFCWRVKQIGGEIWCDPTVRPGHIAHIPVYAGEDPFENARAMT